jgi:predicted SAM-dependent methyltransferase
MKLDFGCGPNCREGFEGVDITAFNDKVKHVLDLRKPLPFEDNSVDEASSSHFVEHLTGNERVGFFNELYRVLKPKAAALIITPNWAHACAYGDPTHQWPPMSSWYPLYLNKDWRDKNAPHVPFTCDFDFSAGGSWDDALQHRNMEYKNFAMSHHTNAMRDLSVTLIKK